MKPSIYFKNHFLSDIFVLLVISGFTYLLLNTWNGNKIGNEPTLELVPFNGNPDDEMG